MANVVVIGMQWGDEGKGKIVDLLCPAFDAVARYQGGHNAGHTVRFGDKHFSLHLIPSGILRPGTACVLGNGMVVDPDAFFTELELLKAAGVNADGRLFISYRAHAVMPFAPILDKAREKARGSSKIGTTARGIGPTYESKASRHGFRLCDLARKDFEDNLRALVSKVEAELLSLGSEGLGHPGRFADHCRDWLNRLKPFLRDTDWLLNHWIDEGKNVLLEGAQGTLLDVDHGTYPYVSSSSSTAGGAATGTGIAPHRITGALGVLKAYTTRVGGGPFTTEVDERMQEYLRKRGNEFGTTTGRPRRCGWLDLVGARYARRINGIQTIALTKLDVLDAMPEIPVCIGYRHRGTLYREHSAEFEVGKAFEPVFRSMPGWRKSTSAILERDHLPQAAQDYVDLIEQEVEAPVSLISTGPRREETIVFPTEALSRLTSGKIDRVLKAR